MPQTLFVSYSHKDEKHKDYVVGHLGIAEKQGLLKTWDDRRIKGGGDWRKEIETALAQAKVAILLVSHHSLTSDFILDEEVSTMLRRRDQEGLVVYPIAIRDCDWDAVDWLSAMNVRPIDGKPLALFSLPQRDQVMARFSKEIREFLDDVVETTTKPEELDSSPVDDEIDRLAEQTEALSAELGTTKDALSSMFEILAEQTEIPVEQLETKLREIAERHVELTKLWQALPKSNDDPEITSRREKATQALEDGDFDQADELLEEARSIIQQARREHQEALDRSLLGEASILSQQGQLERARLNYQKAAGHFAEAASLLPASETDTRLDYLMQQASVLDDHGREFGDNPALIEAIAVYQSVLEEWTRERVPLQWARTQNNIGNALHRLGERESGTDRLEQAVDAYHNALEEFTRERAPLEWAAAQHNLGSALRNLGERESGTEKLEQAIDAYRAALEERTRDRVPLLWANTMRRLDATLRSFESQENGTERLEQAIDVYRAALKKLKRKRVPFKWARTQRNLGSALADLGSGEGGTEKLKQAVDAYQNALKEFTRERLPFDWARAQTNLGDALRVLGSRENSTEMLEQAVNAYCEALKETTRERLPLYWARTQMNLGLTYLLIAERNKNETLLLQGIEVTKAAINIYKGESESYNLKKSKRNLASAMVFLEALKSKNTSK